MKSSSLNPYFQFIHSLHSWNSSTSISRGNMAST